MKTWKTIYKAEASGKAKDFASTRSGSRQVRFAMIKDASGEFREVVCVSRRMRGREGGQYTRWDIYSVELKKLLNEGDGSSLNIELDSIERNAKYFDRKF